MRVFLERGFMIKFLTYANKVLKNHSKIVLMTRIYGSDGSYYGSGLSYCAGDLKTHISYRYPLTVSRPKQRHDVNIVAVL